MANLDGPILGRNGMRLPDRLVVLVEFLCFDYDRRYGGKLSLEFPDQFCEFGFQLGVTGYQSFYLLQLFLRRFGNVVQTQRARRR